MMLFLFWCFCLVVSGVFSLIGISPVPMYHPPVLRFSSSLLPLAYGLSFVLAAHPKSRQSHEKNTGLLLQISGDNINSLHNTFEQVTDYFGIRYERVWGEFMYVIYRVRSGNPRDVVTARLDYALAVHECNYLERLNFS